VARRLFHTAGMGHTASVMSTRSPSMRSQSPSAADSCTQHNGNDAVLCTRSENTDTLRTIRKLDTRTVSVRCVQPVLLTADSADSDCTTEAVIPLRTPLSASMQADVLLHPCLLSFLQVQEIGVIMACSKATATASESEEVWRCICGCAAAQFRLFLPRTCVCLLVCALMKKFVCQVNRLQAGHLLRGRKRFSTMFGQPGTNGPDFPQRPHFTFRSVCMQENAL
jgi:hypothetical protein